MVCKLIQCPLSTCIATGNQTEITFIWAEDRASSSGMKKNNLQVFDNPSIQGAPKYALFFEKFNTFCFLTF